MLCNWFVAVVTASLYFAWMSVPGSASPWPLLPPLLTPQVGVHCVHPSADADSSADSCQVDSVLAPLPTSTAATPVSLSTRVLVSSATVEPTRKQRRKAQRLSSQIHQKSATSDSGFQAANQVSSFAPTARCHPTQKKPYDREQRAAAVTWGVAARRNCRQDPLKVAAARRLLPEVVVQHEARQKSSPTSRVAVRTSSKEQVVDVEGDSSDELASSSGELNDVQLLSTTMQQSLLAAQRSLVRGQHDVSGAVDVDAASSGDAADGEAGADTAQTVARRRKRGAIRGVSAVSDYMYAHCLTYQLDADLVPAMRGRKAIAAKMRKLRKQGVRVDERVNVWRRKRELRLVDKQNRIVLRTSELSDGRMFRHAWDGPNNPTSSTSLLEELRRNYAGIDGRKVNAWCERQPNCRNHTRGVAFEVKPIHIRAERPMQHVQADMTHLPPTTYAGRYYTGILTFVCCFSRHVYCRGVTAESGHEIAEATNDYFNTFGAAAELQTDNGAGFKSKLQKTAANLHGSILKNGRPYRPQSQGNVERTHNLIKRLVLDLAVRAYNSIFKWPEFVSTAMRLYNNRHHRAFGHQLTPFMVMFGRAPNNTTGGDIHLLGGELVQECPRLSLDEQMRILEECVTEAELFGGGVIQRLIPLEILPDEDEELEMDCIYAVQEELDNLALYQVATTRKRVRVAFTAVAAELVMESTAHSFRLEYYRLMLQNVLQERYCQYEDPHPASVFGLVAERELRDYLRSHGVFLAAIRAAAAEALQRYYDDIDEKLRNRMVAPFSPGHGVWVNPITAGRRFHRLGGKKNKAFSRSVAGTVVRMDEAGGSHPYLVALTLDTEMATLCKCEYEVETWFPPSALKPISAHLGRLMAAGVTEQLEGKCMWRGEVEFCTRDAGIHCERSLCAEHCRFDETLYCKRHFGNRLRKGRTRRLFEVITEEVGDISSDTT